MTDIMIPNIRFIDIKAREVEARQSLAIDLTKLDARKKKNGGLRDVTKNLRKAGRKGFKKLRLR